MRIAFDHQFCTLNYGGVARYYARLASELADRPGVTPRVVAPLYINPYLADVPAAVVPGRRLAATRANGRIVRFANAVAGHPLQALFRPDIVHETYYSSHRTAPSRARIVLTIYDMIHEKFPELFPEAGIVIARKAAAVARADHILCISEHTRADLIGVHPAAASKSSVTLLGFDPDPAAAPHVAERPYLLFVGQRGTYKNFSGLLDVYAASPELRGGFDLIAAGGGPFDATEREAIGIHGVETTVRQVRADDVQLRSLYAGAAAFVYPSLYEGFGIPPLEAMAAGTPVVAMNVSSVPEVCGDAAAYANPGDPDSLRHAIEEVVLSPERRKALVAAGTTRLTHFSWSKCADDTLAAYRNLL